MNTLTEHLQLERDVEPPKIEVDALGVTVVEDGDAMAAEHVRSGVWECFCQDQRHRDIDRIELAYPTSYIKDGAHRVPVHVYSVVGAVIA
jgi:hypothetical protein